MPNMKSILVVEDDSLIFKALRNVFAKEKSVKVSFADNGVGGLRKALTEHPDLILLDLVLPMMDGITMLKELRKDPWGKKAQVIVLTNLSDELSVEQSMRSGVSDYLIKSNWKIKDLVRKSKEKLGIK